MIDYSNIKNSYIAALHVGLMLNAGYEEAKRGNELLHKFCESCVENSNYSDKEKQRMKYDLSIVKNTLSQEIEQSFHNTCQ